MRLHKVFSFSLRFSACCLLVSTSAYAQHYQSAFEASAQLEKIAIEGTIERLPDFPEGGQLCPSWEPVKSPKGWKCEGTFFGSNKAKLVKAKKCDKDEKNEEARTTPWFRRKCHDKQFCVHRGKVKVWSNLSNDKTGKVWTDKSVMKYSCDGQMVKGKVTKKIFDKEPDRLTSNKVLSKDTWTMTATYKENVVTGLSTVKFKGRDIVQATCRTETNLGAEKLLWGFHVYRLWDSDLAFWSGKLPTLKSVKNDSNFEGASKSEIQTEFKNQKLEYKTNVKNLKSLTKKCKNFKPKDCDAPLEQKLPLKHLGKANINGKKQSVYCARDLCALYGGRNPALCPQDAKAAEVQAPNKNAEQKALTPAEKKCQDVKKMIEKRGISGKKAEMLIRRSCR